MANIPASGTVLVTGAARRLGRAIALDFGRRGWQVAVHFRGYEAEARATVQEIEARGSRAIAIQADLTETEAVATLIPRVQHELGPVTCLINNASHFDWDSLFTLKPPLWEAHFDVNLRAPVFLAKAFAEALPADTSGCIVNVIDQRVWRLNPDFFSYTLAKSALWTATQTLAQALSPKIRVNAVAPGPVLPSHRQTQAEFEQECRSTLLKHGATVEDVCAAIRFLVDTPSVTGQMIAVDAGQHLAGGG